MERKIDSTVHVRLEAELREQLEALARAEDRPLSYVIRRTLRAEAARQQGEVAA
jgi:predicted transcriptional regulator